MCYSRFTKDSLWGVGAYNHPQSQKSNFYAEMGGLIILLLHQQSSAPPKEKRNAHYQTPPNANVVGSVF